MILNKLDPSDPVTPASPDSTCADFSISPWWVNQRNYFKQKNIKF